MSNPFVPSTHKGAFGVLVGWTLAIVALVLLIGGISFGVRWLMASPNGKLQARTQIKSGASRISSYNHFFDLCASVQGLEGQLDAQFLEEATAKGDDLARVQANVAGIRGAIAQAVAEYNADARKSYTIGQFRSSDLPYQIPTDPYRKGEPTSCTV